MNATLLSNSLWSSEKRDPDASLRPETTTRTFLRGRGITLHTLGRADDMMLPTT